MGITIEIMSNPISGVFPWLSMDAVINESYYSEPQTNINKCCTCGKTSCTNCLAKRGGTSHHRKRSKKISGNLFMKLLSEHKSQIEICKELNISRATYFNYKKAYGVMETA